MVSKGHEGGEEAAQRLLAGIKSHVKATYPDSNVDDWSVIVQVALNQAGLSKVLFERGIVKNPNVELPAFARAFGCSQALFSFVDVGSGKERADHKVREMMRVMMRITQCRHIIFGPCLDKGYLPFLAEYKVNPAAASKITLLETVPGANAFRNLGFRHVDFPDVFRSEPLPERPAVLPIGRPASTAPDAGVNRPGTPKSTTSSIAEVNGVQSWAAVGKSGPAPKTINIAPKRTPPPRKYYLVNVNSERLDEELPRWDPSAEKRFVNRVTRAGRNCCNHYHLKGSCPDETYCDYTHGDRLNPAELLVLRHKARSLKCANGTYCYDPECFFGHHCRFGKACHNPSACRFADSHHVDLVSVTFFGYSSTAWEMCMLTYRVFPP